MKKNIFFYENVHVKKGQVSYFFYAYAFGFMDDIELIIKDTTKCIAQHSIYSG